MKKFYTNIEALCGLSVAGTTSLSTATGVTVATSDNSTNLATTAFVKAQGYATTTALSGYVPITRTITINGTTLDLSADRTWTIPSSAYTSKLQHQVKAGVAINKGQAVYVTGADGTNMIVGLASNATEATSSKTMGLLDATVATNGFANVITEGLLDGLDTSTAGSEGDPVWLGTGGNLIYGLINKPSAPAHLVFIGIVTRKNSNNGEIFVKVQNGFELNEIHDVDLKTTVPVNGHILGFDGTLWVNKTIATWLGYTPANASGTTNYISKFTGSTTLGDSIIYDDGTKVGINTSTVEGGLHINYSAANTLLMQRISPDSGPPEAIGRKARGTVSAKTGVLSGDRLWFFAAAGYYGTEGVDGAWSANKVGMNFVASETWTPSAQGTHITWATTAAGQTTRTDKMILTGTGDLGFGTVAPAAKLHAVGSSTTELRLQNSDANNNYGFVKYETQNSSGGNLVIGTNASGGGYGAMLFTANNNIDFLGAGDLRIVKSGNVGIGTYSPTAKLHVAGSVLVTGDRIDVNSNTRITGAYYENSGTEYTYLQMYNGGDASINIGTKHPLSYISFESGNGAYTERMRITNTGNVGIGTTTPDNKLTVKGDNALVDVQSTADGQTVGFLARYLNNATLGGAFRYTTGDAQLYIDNLFSGNNGVYSDINIRNCDTGGVIQNRIKIKGSTGNVGIGTTSPSTKLQVIGAGRVLNVSSSNDQVPASFNCSTGGVSTIGFYAVGSANDYNVRIGANVDAFVAYTNDTERLRITSAGNVGVGTTSPTNKLQVANGDMSITTGYSFILADTDTNWRLGRNIIVENGNQLTANTMQFVAANAANEGWQFVDDDGNTRFEIGASTGNAWLPSGNLYLNGNLAATRAWVQSQGYLTSYTETDTLATVTARGASTSTAVSLSGGATIAGITNNGNLVNNGKIIVQNYTNGSNARGIFMWADADSNWGIYMSTAASGVSLAGGNAVSSIDGRTSHHIRFRVHNASGNGFIWENSSEVALMSLGGDNGNLYTRGQIYAGNSTSNVVWHAGNDGSGSGLDADLLDGLHASQSGGGNVVLATASNGYLYVNNWIHPANGTGLFYDSGPHFYENGGQMYSSHTLRVNSNILITDGLDNNRFQKGSSFLNLRDPWNNVHFSNAGGGIYIDSNIHYWRSASGSTYWMTLDGGSVGIGTISPAAKLHVYTPSSGSAIVVGRAAGNSSIKASADADGGYLSLDSTGGATIINHYVSDNVWLVTGGGNVGVGIANPANKLEIRNGGGSTGYTGNDLVFYNANGQSAFYHDSGGYVYWYSNQAITFYPGASRSVTFATNGNVGIGTASPSQKLHVAGTAYASGDMRAPIFYDSDDTNYYLSPSSTSYIQNLYVEGGVAGWGNSSSYVYAGIELRERSFGGAQDDTWATAPRLGFHWGGRVASQIALASNGRIHILNDPGTANEAFQAAIIYSNGYGNSTEWNTAYSWGNHASQGYATQTYVNTAIANLVDAAPSTLDTLNELAAALGDDPNFATTVTNSIAGKVSKSGDTMSGALTLNGGLNAYAQPILVNEIKFRDTAGSPQSDPYSIRWISEASTRGAGLSWLEFQLNDDNNEEIRIYGNSCVNHGCGTYSDNLYHRFRADGYAWHAGNLEVVGTFSASGYNKSNWDTAYSWGNHSGLYIPVTANTNATGWISFSSSTQATPIIKAVQQDSSGGYYLFQGITGSSEVFRVERSGNVVIAGTFTETSSRRFKENIVDLEPTAEKVEKLRPVRYNKIDSEATEIGLIAEEVAELFPEVVTYNEDGQPSGVQYQRLSVILLKTIQEQNVALAALTERINKLENK